MSDKKKYPRGEQLKKQFVDTIKSFPSFTLSNDGDLLCVQFNNVKFWIFFKCISYAGNPYPRNTTRAQLPKRTEFEHVKNNDIFLFLGYDIDNDLYVCWDPEKAKRRLNQKSYVSFFCRQSLQDSVVPGEIKDGYLTNGDKFVLFKREDTISFFEMFSLHFNSINTSHNSPEPVFPSNETISGSIESIDEDMAIKLYVDEMRTKFINNKLSLISSCMNSFGSFYPNMRFIDWARLIQEYLKEGEDNDE